MSLSESARATAASQSRFRIDAPNARPRTVKLFPLDAGASAHVADLAAQHPRLVVVDWVATRPAPSADASLGDWFGDMAAWTSRGVAEIADADVVVIVATSKENGDMAGAIADACRERGRLPLALVVRGDALSDADLSVLLGHLRPHAGMLVIADDAAYVDAMLSALRA
jgi:hypothetical protein